MPQGTPAPSHFFMKKRLKYWLLAIVVLLIVTNPSLRDFKDNGHPSSQKTINLLVFSFFIEKFSDGDNTYLGICKNFIQVDGNAVGYRPTVKEWQ